MSEAAFQIYDGAVRSSRTNGWIGTKRGDVIDVREDGFEWGGSEKMRRSFRIFQFPGLPEQAWSDLLEPHMDGDNLIQKRKRYIDFDSQAGKWLSDKLTTSYIIRIGRSDWRRFFSLQRDRNTPMVINEYG